MFLHSKTSKITCPALIGWFSDKRKSKQRRWSVYEDNFAVRCWRWIWGWCLYWLWSKLKMRWPFLPSTTIAGILTLQHWIPQIVKIFRDGEKFYDVKLPLCKMLTLACPQKISSRYVAQGDPWNMDCKLKQAAFTSFAWLHHYHCAHRDCDHLIILGCFCDDWWGLLSFDGNDTAENKDGNDAFNEDDVDDDYWYE